MISNFVYDLCHAPNTVSSQLAANPEEAPGPIAKELFSKKDLPQSSTQHDGQYDLQRAFECGQWGPSRPSDLFLKVRKEQLSGVRV